MPALSPTMEDGTISNWIKKEGDEISAGDAICEIETDKATVDFELADDGVLAKILVDTNSRVKVGDLIGVLVEDSGSVAAFSNATVADFGSTTPAKQTEEVPQKPVEPVEPIVTETIPVSQSTQVETDRIFISPFARKTAKENNINIENLRGIGSGPNGRIKQKDVLKYLASTVSVKEAAPQPEQTSISTPTTASFYDLALEGRQLADNLEQSKKEAPHYFLVSEIELTKLLKLRQHFKTEYDIEVSVNDFIVKASASAMKSVPLVNASFRKDFIRVFNAIDINVFTSSGLGVIRGCEAKGLTQIAEESQEILQTEDKKLELGTFAIANLGMFGVSKVFPIVVHGQSACLGVGEIYQEYVPIENKDSEKLDFNKIEKVNISLSCDHRVVDGAVGAQWLQQFKKLMEDPTMLLL